MTQRRTLFHHGNTTQGSSENCVKVTIFSRIKNESEHAGSENFESVLPKREIVAKRLDLSVHECVCTQDPFFVRSAYFSLV